MTNEQVVPRLESDLIRGPKRQAARVLLFTSYSLGDDVRSHTKITLSFLTIILFSSIFLDYWGYSILQKAHPESWLDVVAGQAQAPLQYRIGVILTAHAVTRHSPLAFRHVFTLIDLVSAFVAVFSLYFLMWRSSVYRQATMALQCFADAGFVALVEFYLMWLLWYQRPETLITAAVLSLSLLFLTVPLPLSRIQGYFANAVAILALAFVQGFIRADVAFSLHVGVLLVCLFRDTSDGGFALPRWLQASTSAASAGICGAIQIYLMHVAYPGATYKDGPMFQLLINLRTPSEWLPFLLFLSPVIWTLFSVIQSRPRTASPIAGFLLGAILFLGLWLIAGRIEEVRIFMPFALCLVPLTISLAMERYGIPDGGPERPSSLQP